MVENKPGFAVGPTILYVVGFLLCGVVVVKASIIGYYDSDMPWLVVCAVLGVVALWVAKKWSERV